MDELNEKVEGVTQGVNNLPDPYENQRIINVEINKEVRTAFLDYSMSVIVSLASYFLSPEYDAVTSWSPLVNPGIVNAALPSLTSVELFNRHLD